MERLNEGYEDRGGAGGFSGRNSAGRGGGFSRRTFLKGALSAGVVSAAALALPSALAFAAKTDTANSADVKTYTTDVVVIGGGLAGMMAARNALAKGASVLIVDKGPFGHSGATGINWGHEIMSYERSDNKMISSLTGI
jgi:NADPH-dependent 2,4-dienoyl-CoA reductase/sulfur reductase-like enzyme